MISRIRVDAYGCSPGDVSDTLYPHADEIEKLLGVPVTCGEFVVERCLEEPKNSVFAFRGRLIMHPNVASEELRLHGTAANATASFASGGVSVA